MHLFSRKKFVLLSLIAFVVLVGAFAVNALVLRHTSNAAAANPNSNVFQFDLVASPGITACLPQAHGSARIVPLPQNDLMTLSVEGLAPNTEYALFVIQLPNKPFGISWYQSDLETNGQGIGSVQVRGIFNVETFSLSPGGPTTAFAPTHQYHLGFWFADPQVPFDLGCEPGATSPTITPFDGDQQAGIQVLNTSNFPDNAGPLSHVSP
jgi:hypothetical protein